MKDQLLNMLVWYQGKGDQYRNETLLTQCVEDYLSESPVTGGEVWRLGNRIKVTSLYEFNEGEGFLCWKGEVIEQQKGLCLKTDCGKYFNTQGTYYFGSILDQKCELISTPIPSTEALGGMEVKEAEPLLDKLDLNESGIKEYDELVKQFINREISFYELTDRLWTKAYQTGYELSFSSTRGFAEFWPLDSIVNGYTVKRYGDKTNHDHLRAACFKAGVEWVKGYLSTLPTGNTEGRNKLDTPSTSTDAGSEIDHAAEREVMIKAFDKVRQLFEQRSWIMDGRGPYSWNDDEYKKEVRYLYDEFDELAKDVWANIKTKSADFRKEAAEYYLQNNPSGSEMYTREQMEECWESGINFYDESGKDYNGKKAFNEFIASLSPQPVSEAGPHECPNCNWQCICSSQPCSCCSVSEGKEEKKQQKELIYCQSDADGECFHKDCPQNKEGEPGKTGRSCPLIWPERFY